MIRTIAWTGPGRVRPLNEDAIVLPGLVMTGSPATPISMTTRGSTGEVFAVIDGLGGHAGGQRASRHIALGLVEGCEDVTATLLALHDSLYEEMRLRPELTGMGATIAGTVVTGERLTVFNVGDVRVYQHRFGYATILTTDDRRSGSNVVTQSLGGTATPTALTVHRVEVDLDDATRLLICSDGVTDVLEFGAIQAALDEQEPVTALRRAVTEALERGAPDNVSAVLVERRARTLGRA